MNDMQDYLKYNHNEIPKCPKCDYDIIINDHDLYDLYNEDDHYIFCPECGASICVNSSAKWTFSTSLDYA